MGNDQYTKLTPKELPARGSVVPAMVKSRRCPEGNSSVTLSPGATPSWSAVPTSMATSSAVIGSWPAAITLGLKAGSGQSPPIAVPLAKPPCSVPSGLPSRSRMTTLGTRTWGAAITTPDTFAASLVRVVGTVSTSPAPWNSGEKSALAGRMVTSGWFCWIRVPREARKESVKMYVPATKATARTIDSAVRNNRSLCATRLRRDARSIRRVRWRGCPRCRSASCGPGRARLWGRPSRRRSCRRPGTRPAGRTRRRSGRG